MVYTLEELNPVNVVLNINENKIILKKLSIGVELDIVVNHISIEDLIRFDAENISITLDVLWELTDNKKDFNNSKITFINKVLSTKNALSFNKTLHASLIKVIHDSRPVQSLKRSTRVQEEGVKPCYAKYFDIIAKRYGYTLQDFYNLTLRQIHIILKTINSESYKELETQAALLGRQLKPRNEEIELTQEEEDAQDEMAMALQKRLMDEYKEKLNAK